MQHSCDLCIFTETWLTVDHTDDIFQIDEYLTIRKDRCSGKGGGILCYIRKDYSWLPVPCNYDPELEIMSFILLPHKHLFIIIYHPHWHESVAHDTMINALLSIISLVKAERNVSDVSIVGDFNGLVSHMDALCDTFKLVNIIDFPTRGDAILDCIFTSCYRKYLPATKLSPIANSDHCVIVSHGSSITRSPIINKVTIHDYCPNNKLLFHSLMTSSFLHEQLDWDAHVEDFCNHFIQLLHSLHDYCFPLKTIRIYQNPNCPWMNNTIRMLMRRRDLAYRRNQGALFKHFRNKVKTVIKRAKQKYFGSIKKVQTKDEWRKIKNCLHINKQKPISSNFSVNELQDYFMSVYSKEDFSVEFMFDDLPSLPITVSTYEVQRELEHVRKCGGIPFLPKWIWHTYANTLALPVTHIFRISLSSGYIPKVFKMANVTPIPKIKSPVVLSDFRPIATTSPLMKILEKIVLKKWLSPLVSENLFHDQFAFVPLRGRGCQSALTTLYGSLLKLVNDGYYIDMILIDFSKAFDCAQPSVILNALAKCGASTDCIFWIYNFLSDRQQRVTSNSSSSEFQSVPSGTPQGSVISPLLFAFMLHDLQPVSSQCSLYKYADDITMLYWFRKNDIESSLHLEIANLENWCTLHSQKINPSKTKFLHFCGRKVPQPNRIIINDAVIERVSSARILGILFHDSLKWNLHISNIISMASKRLFNLLLLRRSKCSSQVILSAYESFVRSIILYCFPTFCNIPVNLKKLLIKFERHASIIMNLKPRKDVILFSDELCRQFTQQVISYSHHPFRRLLLTTNRSSQRRSSQGLTVHAHSSSLIRDSVMKFFLSNQT
jgi:hypothetical protein